MAHLAALQGSGQCMSPWESKHILKGLWITHNKKEEMSQAEGAVEEKSEKEGMTERNHRVLSPACCIIHHLTE